MTIPVHYINMPEGGGERDVPPYGVHHNCPMSKVADDPDDDLIIFTPAVSGADIPSNTPFIVESMNSCKACGKGPFSKWFEWRAPRIYVP